MRAADLFAQGRSSAEIAKELRISELTRSQLTRMLRVTGPDVLGRVGVHSERGPRTLEQLLATAAAHIPHHVRFLAEKRVALGLPD